MRTEEAARLKQALDVLKRIPEAERTDAERRAIASAEAKLPQIDQTLDNTNALYRGFAHDLLGGQIDTAAGVASGVKSFVQGNGYLPGYREGRDAVRAKDEAAYAADPEAFDRGQLAGSIALTGPTLGVGLPAMSGLPLIAKSLIGGGVGAAMGGNIGIQDAQTRGAPTETVSDMWREGKTPAAVGGLVGMATYPIAAASGRLARGIGNIAEAPIEGFGRRASAAMSGEFGSAQRYGDDIAAYLDNLPPEGMLADAPGMRGTASAVATMGGDGSQVLSRAMNDRAAGASGRITSVMDDAITAPTDAFQRRQAEAAARTSTWGPMYDAARASTSPLDVSSVLQRMDDAKAGPNTRAVLDKYRKAIREAAQAKPEYVEWAKRKADAEQAGQAFSEPPPLQLTAEELHWIRSDLGDEAFAAGQSKTGTLLGSSLRDMDEILDTVPDYASARTGYANSRAMDDAITEGEGALRGGRVSALSPDELEVKFNSLSDAQKDAFRSGLRRDIAALMGTARNDAAAAWGEFNKSWNAEKLRVVLGDDAEPIIKRLFAESEFSQSRSSAFGGSQTAPRRSAVERLSPQIEPATGQQPGIVSRTKRALIDEPFNSVIDSIVYGPGASRANAEVGQMLAATGSERDRIVSALIAREMNRPRIERGAKTAERIVAALLGATSGQQASAATQQ